jgi:hypothetical protein
MRRLDRLGWAAGIAFSNYGVRIGVRTNDPALWPHLAGRLPPGAAESASPVVDVLYSVILGTSSGTTRRYHIVYDGISQLARTLDLAEAVDALESSLHLTVASHAENVLFVHAGAVTWAGRAILIPGRSMSGKSTLVSALLEAGARYYSDEYAVLDRHGRVLPYPRAIHVRGGENGGRRVRVPVLDPPEHRAVPVGLIAVTRFRAGAVWRPQTLAPAEALLALLSNTVQPRSQPRDALAVLRRVVTARAVKSERGDARDVARALLDEVESCRAPRARAASL